MAVMPDLQFREIGLGDYQGKWLVFFFYPLDFSAVCPTEVMLFSEQQRNFAEAGAELLGCSVDSHFSHLAWLEKEIGRIKFPLLSDITKKISRSYNTLVHDAFSLRGTFIIDPDGILQSMTINDSAIGRSVDEILRTLKAIQTGELIGAGWRPGEPTLGKVDKSEYKIKKSE
jgi:alkyl hydroperoxide reductase subunit AhpC